MWPLKTWSPKSAARAGRPVIAGRRPHGEWTRASQPEPLVDTLRHIDGLRAFARAARRAEARGTPYGVRLQVVADPLDGEACIRVHGTAETPGYFAPRFHDWPLGALPADLARRVTADYLDLGIPLAVELIAFDDTSVIRAENGSDAAPADVPLVSVALLVPPGNTVGESSVNRHLTLVR